MEIDPIRTWKLLTRPLTGRHLIRACRAEPKMWQSHLFTDFQACFYDFFFFPPDLTTNIEIIDLCMFWLPDLSVQTQINNKAFLKTCISHIYLAHVSRMCRLLFFCFDCWEYCFIGTRNKVEQIRNDIFENMYLACVSRTCILHACAWRLCTSTSGDWD